MNPEPDDHEDRHHGEGPLDWYDDAQLGERRELVGQRDIFGWEVVAWYGRTWQAEWEPCPWCPRAYTRRGVLRKARRWSSRNLEWQLTNARRRQRARAHITARRDPFYAELRKAGKL